jgi:hypothetical protein
MWIVEGRMHTNRNNISVSSAPLNSLFDRPYYDLDTTLEITRLLKTAVDGIEFQHLAEWDSTGPPRDDPHNERIFAWERSRKYTRTDIQAALQDAGVNVLSVHANRDVGILLCSEDVNDVRRGKHLMHASLSLARDLGAGICVFHFWDPVKSNIDVHHLIQVYNEVTGSYPTVKAAVENIPCNYQTPFALASRFTWITLDIRWATKFDELEKFKTVKNVVNVHMRGELYGERWVLNDAPYGFYEVMDMIRGWGYTGVFTMEPEGGLKNKMLQDLARALVSMKEG